MSRAIAPIVDSGALAGAAMIVFHDGRSQATCVGWRDIDQRLPIERDTIFRIASMTKPITSTVAMMLIDEGRIALDEPITRWAPEFAAMRVLRAADGPLRDTGSAVRVITFDDLLTHRSGLTYGSFHRGPIGAAYADALVRDIDSPLTPDEWIQALAALPLIDQPGAAFPYGVSTDLLGLLIERIEEAPLSDVMARRIFAPLGMRDTGFRVPREKWDRRCRNHGFDDNGRPRALAAVPGGAALAERPEEMTFCSGGAGLWSTLDDFLAFARMFVGRGTVDGVRLLKEETLARMTSNQLTGWQRAHAEMLVTRPFAAGHGFGLGVAVVLEPQQAMSTPCGGGRGSVGWPGAYGGWWRADPTDRSVFIFLTHNMVELHQFAAGIGLGAFAAIDEFQRLAPAAARG